MVEHPQSTSSQQGRTEIIIDKAHTIIHRSAVYVALMALSIYWLKLFLRFRNAYIRFHGLSILSEADSREVVASALPFQGIEFDPAIVLEYFPDVFVAFDALHHFSPLIIRLLAHQPPG
jgi:hypothetical protein